MTGASLGEREQRCSSGAIEGYFDGSSEQLSQFKEALRLRTKVDASLLMVLSKIKMR